MTRQRLTARKGQKWDSEAGLLDCKAVTADALCPLPTRAGQACGPHRTERTRSPCQVAGLPALGGSPTPAVSCIPWAGHRTQSVSQAGKSQQLSGLKNEMGREIHKLRVSKNLFVG